MGVTDSVDASGATRWGALPAAAHAIGHHRSRDKRSLTGKSSDGSGRRIQSPGATFTSKVGWWLPAIRSEETLSKNKNREDGPDALASKMEALCIPGFTRHILLCCDQTEPECCDRTESLLS